MKTFRRIMLIGFAPHLVGCAFFGLIMMGPIGFVGAPFLAIFGIVFLPAEWFASFLQWAWYVDMKSGFYGMLFTSAICASLFMMALGPKDPAEGVKMVIAYAFSGASAAIFSAYMLKLEYRNERIATDDKV